MKLVQWMMLALVAGWLAMTLADQVRAFVAHQLAETVNVLERK